MKIIFVCHGNICRSPMAEYMMKDLVRRAGRDAEFEISSAAVSYEEQGNPLYPPATSKLREKGVPYGRHSAHRITPEEAAGADLIIIMDKSNERLIRNIIRAEDMPKVHYMMEYAGTPDHLGGVGATSSGLRGGLEAKALGLSGGVGEKVSKLSGGVGEKMSALSGRRPSEWIRDVADPWYTGDFEQTYQDILAGCQGLLALV